MIVNYLIAFGGRPKNAEVFLKQLKEIAAGDGIDVRGAVLAPGPGCYNLAVRMEENEAFVSALTMALMPAKWCTTGDEVAEGVFEDRT